jgi:hypothetical protein
LSFISGELACGHNPNAKCNMQRFAHFNLRGLRAFEMKKPARSRDSADGTGLATPQAR